MNTWDYAVLNLSSGRENVAEALRDYGKYGWELVSCLIERENGALKYSCVFKRENRTV